MKYQGAKFFILNCISRFKWLIAGQIFVALIWAIDLSLRPYLLKIILNYISILDSNNAISVIAPIAAFYIFMAAMVTIIFRFHDFIWLILNPELKKHIGIVLMHNMYDHSFHYYQNHFAGNLANKIKDVMSGVPDLIKIFIDRFFSNSLALFIAIYTLWQANVKFALGLSVWVVIYLTFSIILSLKAEILCKKAAEIRSLIVGYIVDILSNIISVQLFNAKQAENLMLSNVMQKYVKADQERDWFFLKMFSFQGLSFVIYQAACLYWLVTGLEDKTITLGDFALVLAVNNSIISSLWALSQDIGKFAELTGNISQALNIIYTKHEIEEKENAKELIIQYKTSEIHDSERIPDLNIGGGKVVFEDVEFSYHGTNLLFKNKSITIEPGQKVGLVGYSGSGKSSFVNLILRLFDVNAGRILIDDQDIREVTLESLRKSIALIPQDPALFHRSLMENIRYGKLNATDQEVIEAAKSAHAYEFISELPLKYASLVGERGIKLSSGQRQRIAIARAILKNAPILILDEATSHLDSITEQFIQESLLELMEAKTTIVIAHRLSTLLHMDRILVFDKGKIVEDGTHKQLLARGELYTTLWEAQVGGFLPSSIDGVQET